MATYPNSRKLFDGPRTLGPIHENPAYYNDFMEGVTNEGGQVYDEDETQSQDGRDEGPEDMDIHDQGQEYTYEHDIQGYKGGVEIYGQDCWVT